MPKRQGKWFSTFGPDTRAEVEAYAKARGMRTWTIIEPRVSWRSWYVGTHLPKWVLEGVLKCKVKIADGLK